MIIRRYETGEEAEIRALFFNTVHKINSRHYTRKQIDAWAPADFPEERAFEKIRAIKPFVAILEGKIVGFADLQADGYIDCFFCHHEFQGQGVGKALFTRLKAEADKQGISTMYANVSITARPFFEAMGFTVQKAQLVESRGQKLTNYVMVLNW